MSTIQYCINNTIPCFSINITWNKETNKKVLEFPLEWQKLKEPSIDNSKNGLAILTGIKYWVLDFDNCFEELPENIQTLLLDSCEAIVKTRRGFHFYFLICPQSSSFTSKTKISINGNKYLKNDDSGIDIRAKSGCILAPPSSYKIQNEIVKYFWFKGNLETAKEAPTELLSLLEAKPLIAKSVANDTDAEDDINYLLPFLNSERVNNYMDWVNVGIALKNSGYSCDIWDNWSKQSSKYRPGECYKKWFTFQEKDHGLSKASLYHWLKEDNYKVFIELQQNKKELRDKLLTCTNASVAEVFYELNPCKYVFSVKKGWYCLQTNNTWMPTGSKDILCIPDILNKIRKDCSDIINTILQKSNNDSILVKQLFDTYKKISSTSFLKGVTAFLQGLYYKKDIEKKMNANRDIFAFNNFILNMKTFEFRPITPDDYITVTCEYNYREPLESEKNMVLLFMKKIFPKEEVLKYVLEALTTTFEGYNRSEFFHVFTGLGANGKSCLVDLCKVVFGGYFRTLSSSYLTKEDDGKKDKPLPELADAEAIRMLVTSEPEEKDKLQVGMIKLCTGSDAIKGRALYSGDVNEYVPQFKLWIMANDIPKLSKYDLAIERRMRCVHFSTRFVTNPRNENEQLRDETLKERIVKEDSWKYGFLGLLLDTAKKVAGEVIKMPAEVQEFTDGYLLENNPVGAWLKKYYERTGSRNDIIKQAELYKSFVNDNGMIKSRKAFGDDIKKCLIGEKRVHGIDYYYGIVRKNNINEDE